MPLFKPPFYKLPLFKTGWLLLALLSYSSLGIAIPLTLKQAEALALTSNPALHAADSNAVAMATIPSQVSSLPDPTLSLNAMNLPVDSFSTTQENMTQLQLGISQSLPFPGKLALKAEAAESLAGAAASNRDELRLLLLRNVRIHWWNLAYLDKALMLVQSNQALLRNLVRVSEAKYKTGSGLQQDVLLAQLELSHLLERELSLKTQREFQVAELNALLGRDSVAALTLPEQLPEIIKVTPNIIALKQWARDNRPMLTSLNRHVDAADSMVALAEKNYYPDFKLGAVYGVRQGINPVSRQSRSDLGSIMLSMTLPIYTGNKQDRAVDQRKAEKAKAEYSWQDGVNRVNAEIDAAAADLRITREQLSLFKQGIIPQARQTTASMLAGYQVNKVDFLNLVRAQLAEFNNDIQYWQLYARAAQAEARLAAASGKKHLEKDVINHE
ncbi:cobalt-zinc-cadmium resistance protein CzcC precursor [Mariprofundus micogutta]|uniref:Cobalt-zinc-cadmium resistance protein CzcC n=1 Tax=Mariprofundus micogutta TaxID=1921010 RepID=A0A1L8CNW9_9PROT|nr:TolC family protein [Mariprofundus micogutta]GAV20611.1 cobalt-zinc-cadmium resistance protein CzcC precursor [Mariprofundus micogutta]